MIPASYITVDLETIDGSPEEAESFIRERWQPDSIATWSEMTIGKKAKEALAKKKEKLALLTGAPIICASMKSDTFLCCFHCLSNVEVNVPGASIFGYPDMPGMLIGLRDFWNANVAQDTVIVGHNIINFDLPKLRSAYVRNKVRMPEFLTSHANVYDTMQAYTKKFGIGTSAMVGLTTLLEEFGVDNHKDIVSGADVQGLYESGDHSTIIKYALLDVMSESELYLRMTGRSEALR